MDAIPIANTERQIGRHCPHCGCCEIQRWGKYGYAQRYRCGNCLRTFNALTGTPLARLRRPELWIEYIGITIEHHSIRNAAAKCGIAPSTAFRWRKRFGGSFAGKAALRDIYATASSKTLRAAPDADVADNLLDDFVGEARADKEAEGSNNARRTIERLFSREELPKNPEDR